MTIEMTYADIATLVGLALTIVALVIAGYQSIAAGRQTEKLREIGDALSTRYLGEFPEYLPDVAALIARSKRPISIISSIPCHGVFTSPDGWLAVKHAVEDALKHSRKLKVTCVFSNEQCRRKLICDQFASDFEQWDSWRSTPEIKSKMAHLITSFGKNEAPESLTSDAFLELFEVASIEELHTTYRGADVKSVAQRLPIYLWMSDDKEAIFAVPTSVPRYSAQAFLTRDAKLLAAFANMHKEYAKIEPGQ